MAMTAAEQQICAAYLCEKAFPIGTTANMHVGDALAAVQAVDTALDATLNTAVAAVGGTVSIINALAGQLPAPWNTRSVADKVMVAVVVFLGRGGLI